jgi:hypothetical protein
MSPVTILQWQSAPRVPVPCHQQGNNANAAVHKAFVAHDIAGLQQVLPPAQFARFEQGVK